MVTRSKRIRALTGRSGIASVGADRARFEPVERVEGERWSTLVHGVPVRSARTLWRSGDSLGAVRAVRAE